MSLIDLIISSGSIDEKSYSLAFSVVIDGYEIADCLGQYVQYALKKRELTFLKAKNIPLSVRKQDYIDF